MKRPPRCTYSFVLGAFAEVRPGEHIHRPETVSRHSWSQTVRRLREYGYVIRYHRATDTWTLDGMATEGSPGFKLARHTLTDAELNIIADLVVRKLQERAGLKRR